MHTKILLIAMQLLITFGAMGQATPPKQTPCYEEPFKIIKDADIKINKNAILVIGEIKRNGYIEYFPGITLTQTIAMSGGILLNTSGFVRIFRGEEILNANIKLIKKALEKDILIEKGDILYFPVKCSKKQFLDKIKQDLRGLPNHRDYPPVKRKSKSNSDQKKV